MPLNIFEIELARRNLYDFTCYTKPNFRRNWFHERYYKKLDEFRRGEIKRLMVFVPPQHGKSEGSTRRLPAQMIGLNPDLKIGIGSYAANKARKFGREIKRVMMAPEYRQIFPDIHLSENRDGYQNAANEFEMVGREGSIKLDGYTGAWTGDPIDVFILDDLYKNRADAQSEAVSSGVIDFWNYVAETRLHNDSQVLIVFTRWANTDLAGYLLEHEADEWDVVVYPALKVGEPTEEDPREHGEALLPFKHNRAKLEKTRARDSELFESLYQQNPQPLEGLLFPESELNFYDPELVDVEALSEFKFSFIDPADTGGDSLSMPVGYLIQDKIYIPELIYNTDGTDINEPACVELICRLVLNAVDIEGVSAWKLFGKAVRNKVEPRHENCEIRITKENRNKPTRILEASAFIKNQMVFRKDYKSIPQYAAFMKNLTAYLKTGKVAHEDAADSLAGLANYFRVNFSHLW